jgi:ribosomal protein L29
MKRKDFVDLRGKSVLELRKLLGGKRIEAARKKAEILAGKEKNIRLYKNLRQEIAKILTLIREKEILESIAKAEKLEDKKEGKEKA